MFPTEAVPEKIGAYKVIRRLSGAGTADVYLGRMEGPMGFQRTVALKLVANTAEGDARFAEELAREAAICARLNHPVVVRMFDFFEHENRLVLVLEHVEGTDLDRVLQQLGRRRQKLSDGAVWYLGHQVASALAHAHAATDEQGIRAPVIHRNLSPENVLIAWDGQVRLTGFGLGKILGRSPDTVVGTVKGTPGYMSPEQTRGEPVTPKADVYGFGLFMWSLLTGQRPPIDGTRPEDISKLRQDIPREIAAAIQASLEPSPDKRKISCHDMEQWLAKITRTEAGKEELREKVLLLRSARSGTAPAEHHEPARSRAAVAPRRRTTLQGGMRAGSRPADLNPPTPRPSAVEPHTAKAQSWKESIPDGEAIDHLFEEPGANQASLAAKVRPEAREQPLNRASSESDAAEETASSGVKLRDRTPSPAEASSPPAETVRSPNERAEAALGRPLPPPLPEMSPAETTKVSARPEQVKQQISFGTPPAAPLAPPDTGAPAAAGIPPAAGVPPAPGIAMAPAFATPVVGQPLPAAPAPSAANPAQPMYFPEARPASEFTPPLPDTRQIPGFGPIAPGWPGYEGGMSPPAGPVQGPPGQLPPMSMQGPMGFPGPPVPGYGGMPTNPGPSYPPDGTPRSISLLASFGLAAGTAAIVVLIGIYFAIQPESTELPAPNGSAPIARVESIASKPPEVPPPAIEKPPATAVPQPPAAPAATAATLLPDGYGVLTVTFPAEGNVYVSGKLLGPVNQPLQVLCGNWYVRIGRHQGGRYPEWLSAGQTVRVPCQTATQVAMGPRR